jgi:hypothetical protein
MELNGTHGDGGGQKMVNQMLQLEKKKEKNPMEIILLLCLI